MKPFSPINNFLHVRHIPLSLPPTIDSAFQLFHYHLPPLFVNAIPQHNTIKINTHWQETEEDDDVTDNLFLCQHIFWHLTHTPHTWLFFSPFTTHNIIWIYQHTHFTRSNITWFLSFSLYLTSTTFISFHYYYHCSLFMKQHHSHFTRTWTHSH